VVCPARPAVTLVAAGQSKLVFFCTDCDGGYDDNAWVPVEGFSGYPTVAKLAAS
jgi:hypothetical protein